MEPYLRIHKGAWVIGPDGLHRLIINGLTPRGIAVFANTDAKPFFIDQIVLTRGDVEHIGRHGWPSSEKHLRIRMRMNLEDAFKAEGTVDAMRPLLDEVFAVPLPEPIWEGPAMKQIIDAKHFLDDKANPSGGVTLGLGLDIRWQSGPLGRGQDRQEPNGCYVETVIAAAIDRLEFYQDSKFSCPQNESAIAAFRQGLHHLNLRTLNRQKRSVEGTHQV